MRLFKWLSQVQIGLLCALLTQLVPLTAQAWIFSVDDEPAFERSPLKWAEEDPTAMQAVGACVLKIWPDRNWWLKFKDPMLAHYMSKAYEHNYDLKIAAARIQQSKALVRDAISKQLPVAAVGASWARLGLPRNLSKTSGTLPRTVTAFAAPLSVSYEVDLWGKYWDQTTSARHSLRAQEWDSRLVEITMASEVATAYFNMVRADRNYELGLIYSKNLQQIVTLERALYQAGLKEYEEVLRAERDEAQAEMDVWSNDKDRSVAAHQLSILTGEFPTTIMDKPHTALEAIQLPLQVDAGEPLMLVTKRPDILEQEALLEKARIDVRVARKQFLPTAKLSGFFGFTADNLGNAFDGDSFFSLLLANLNQPIFQGGKIIANLRLQQAKQREQLETYRHKILNAYKEVEDALSGIRTNYGKIQSNIKEKNADVENLTLIQSLYQQGLNSQLEVIQAENILVYYDLQAVDIKMDTAISFVSLYKALGGGY